MGFFSSMAWIIALHGHSMRDAAAAGGGHGGMLRSLRLPTGRQAAAARRT